MSPKDSTRINIFLYFGKSLLASDVEKRSGILIFPDQVNALLDGDEFVLVKSGIV